MSEDEKVYQTKVDRTLRIRRELRERFGRFNDENPHAGETAYALLNATTEFTTHSPVFTGSAEKGLVSQLFGQKKQINDRAWAKSLEYAEVEF